MTAVAQTTGVSKTFGGVRAVVDVSVDFEPATLYGLIGPNGAGKSTLVNLISGETTVDAGTITLAGEDLTRLPPHARALRGIARTFQTMRIPTTMTVAETVLTGSLIACRAATGSFLIGTPSARNVYRQARGAVDEILGLVGLDDVVDAPIRELPFAQQRRLEMARALALEPQLLLLDEPTAGMNLELLPGISRMFRTLADKGLAVVIIEHNVPFIREMVDQLYAMDSGRLIGAGDPHAVLREPAVVASYLGEAAETS